MIGMSPEQYWEGDPYLVRFYYQKHKLWIEQRNQELWLQGFYIFKAVETVMANSFSKRTYHYLDKPIDLFKTEEAKTEEEVLKERAKVIEAFKGMRKTWEQKNG